MGSEKVYFYSFVYMSLLVWASLMAVAWFRRLLKSGRRGLAWGILFAVIFADLAVYGSQAFKYVTQARGGFKFSERKSPYVFVANRKERLFFDDLRFRYFRPALHKVYTAFDLSTMDYFVVTYGAGVSPSLILSQILDGDFPLQREAAAFSVADFLALGKTDFGHWDTVTRVAYLGVMETVLQDMLLQAKFYSIFGGFNQLADNLQKNIRVGYLMVVSGKDWKQREETVEGMDRLMQLSFGSVPGVSAKLPAADKSFWTRVAEHGQRFRTIPVSEYFASLWYRYRLRDVNSFVRFKDYDRISNLFERPLLSSDVMATRRRIRSDLGITSPLIRFYSEAKAIAPGEYYSRLSRGQITDDGLYLETGSPVIDRQGKGQRIGFSYNVAGYGPNRVRIAFHAPLDGYLYFSDGYDRYWTASVDGRKTKVYKANGAFKAAMVPAGSHILEFVYDPVFFRFSLWVYYILALGCIAYLVVRPLTAKKAARIPSGSS